MTEKASGFRGGESVAVTGTMIFNAVSQLLWPHKDPEEWFSLGENHEKVLGFGLHQLRNRCSFQVVDLPAAVKGRKRGLQTATHTLNPTAALLLPRRRV